MRGRKGPWEGRTGLMDKRTLQGLRRRRERGDDMRLPTKGTS